MRTPEIILFWFSIIFINEKYISIKRDIAARNIPSIN